MSVSGGGRLPEGLDAAMAALNTSVFVDKELWREDIRGSIAHARGLEQVAGEIERNELVWDPEKEDVHMNIESRLTAIIGPLGGKLHTARSRNDQIATDLRLWVRRKSGELELALAELAHVLVARAEENIELLMPAYTHLQRAQPSRVSHHLMAWQELLWRDLGRLRDAARRADECPLGAGAVAGSGFALDRTGVANGLGFGRRMGRLLDAPASRGWPWGLGTVLA